MKNFRPHFQKTPTMHRKLKKFGCERLTYGRVACFNLVKRERYWFMELFTIFESILDHALIVNTYEDMIMARNSDFKYVNIKLTPADKKPLETWAKEQDWDILTAVDELASRKYKLGVTWSDKQNSWCVSITGQEGAKQNALRSMSSWSSDWVEALIIGLYKVLVVCNDGRWEDFEADQETWG